MIAAQLHRDCSGDARAMAGMLAGRTGVLAVLFYGNLQRDPGAGGLLDFYVLTESDAAYHGRGIAALANRLLPPNVSFETLPEGPKAKVAVMRLDAFAHRMRSRSWDTTLWARFCQPSVLAYARDQETARQVRKAVIAAHETAAIWATSLAAPGADAATAWESLFRHTYGAELRVEGTGRAEMLAKQGAEIYALLHAEVVESLPSQAPSRCPGLELEPRPGAYERSRLKAGTAGHKMPKQSTSAYLYQTGRAWRNRRRVGKLLNLARLIKACFTFRGAIPYALDKVERHSGRPVELSPWAKRHPWLAAPVVFVRLLRERRLR